MEGEKPRADRFAEALGEEVDSAFKSLAFGNGAIVAGLFELKSIQIPPREAPADLKG